MVHNDFDIDGLARYLHVTPAQVKRLADRGKIPGRKVSSRWKFARADIHHWLEDRIGLSDEEELVEVESVLHRTHRPDNASTNSRDAAVGSRCGSSAGENAG